ncbi:MAG: ABC transporter permease [Acidobacteriota bacterium]
MFRSAGSPARALLVAGREVHENVRTKTFWIGILSVPVLVILAIAVPILIEMGRGPRDLTVVDRSGWVLGAVEAEMTDADRSRFALVPPPEGDEAGVLAELNRRVVDGDLFAYFVVGADPVADGTVRYVSSNLTDEGPRRWFVDAASAAVRDRRLAQEEISAELAEWIQAPLEVEARTLGAAGEEEDVGVDDYARQWAPVAFVYLLWISIFAISQMLLTNTIEEKSNRIMEVLLSSLSPLELMAGKVLGIAATGLIMVLSWLAFAGVAVSLVPAAVTEQVGELGSVVTDPRYVLSFVVYFLLGYLFYAGLLVAVGSVCSTLKEAQGLQTPVVIVIMVPLLAMVPIAQDPNGLLARILSFIPPFTPFVMMNRAAGPPALWEYAVTTVLLVLAVAFVLWAAAKVFRVGVLMTGKPPRLGEMLRWVRAPVGGVADDD